MLAQDEVAAVGPGRYYLPRHPACLNQGLPHVHCSAQPDPFWPQTQSNHSPTPTKQCSRQDEKMTSGSLWFEPSFHDMMASNDVTSSLPVRPWPVARSDAESARAEAKEARRHTDYVIAVVKASEQKNAAARASSEAEAAAAEAAETVALRRRVDAAEADNRELRIRLDETRRQLTAEAHARASTEATAAGANAAAADTAAAAAADAAYSAHIVDAATSLDADDRLRVWPSMYQLDTSCR